MIYTITLNPAIDQIILTQKDFSLNKTNYYEDDYFVVGGKGINAGIILNNLEAEVEAIGILGNENKDIFLNKFKEINLKNHFILNSGKTRTNYKIKNLFYNEETELNGLGFETSQDKINEFLKYLNDNLKQGDYVIATGSVARRIETDIYQKIGKLVNSKKCCFICDTAGILLEKALKEKPFLIKPNLDELKDLLNVKDFDESNFDNILDLISQVRKMGARNILLSMGSKGSYYFAEDNSTYKVGIAKGNLVNSVGAGDSMLAGYTYGLSNNLDIKKILQFSASCGGATAFTQWLATKEEILSYVDTIDVKKIK